MNGDPGPRPAYFFIIRIEEDLPPISRPADKALNDQSEKPECHRVVE